MLDYLNVRDNILLPFRVSPALQLESLDIKRVDELVQMVGIADKLKQPIHRLSQGERQRVSICFALITGAPLLLADEPTGNLYPENTDRILDMLFDLVKY